MTCQLQLCVLIGELNWTGAFDG